MVIALLVLLSVVSERWWVSAALTYVPRAPFLLPSLLLLLPCLLVDRRLLLVNALCGVLVAGPIMGATAPIKAVAPAPANRPPLVVLSCNVQNGESELARAIAEFDAARPDIVALQETKWGYDALTRYFADWHTVHVGEFWVSARFPVKVVAECESATFERKTALLCQVEAPHGPLLLCNVHLNTARHGLVELQWHSPLTGVGVENFEWHEWQRQLEAEETLKFVTSHAGEKPLIVLGDFNTPTTSNLFVEHWSAFRSAFELAGRGYGYTAPCNTSRWWPRNTPWVRIDHILVDAAWDVHACEIGRSDGSDHRLIKAQVSLRQ